MPDERPSLPAALAARLTQLSNAELDSLEKIVKDELELRSGTALSSLITTEQLEEFESLFEAGDEDAMSAFLDCAIPDYREIVTGIMEEIIDEVAERIAEADGAGDRGS